MNGTPISTIMEAKNQWVTKKHNQNEKTLGHGSHSLSRYSPSAGIATFKFFRLRTVSANSCIFPSSMQLPGMLSQWSNTHCGNACPLVCCRNAATKPKDSDTGRYARDCTSGVPSRWFSSKTHTRRIFIHEYTPLIASCGHTISTKKTGSWRVGLPIISAAKHTRRVGGMI